MLLNKQIVTIIELMERLMYAAFVQVLGGKLWEESGLQSSKKKWTRRLEHFTLQDEETLLFNNRKVPTIEEVDQVLVPIHYVDDKKHYIDVKVLRKALSDHGFVLPPFLGGLERACKQ